MKKLIAFICAMALLFGYAFCEEVTQASPEEILNTPVEIVPEETIIEEEIPVYEPEPEPTPEETPEPMQEPILEPTQEPTPEPTPETTPEPIPTIEPEIVVEVIVEPSPEPTIGPVIDNGETSSTELIEIRDDDYGEVTLALAREVYISFLKEPQYFGDSVTLIATLVNFKETDKYTIYWQYCTDSIIQDWTYIENEFGNTYNFILDKINYRYYYRVIVELEEE